MTRSYAAQQHGMEHLRQNGEAIRKRNPEWQVRGRASGRLKLHVIRLLRKSVVPPRHRKGDGDNSLRLHPPSPKIRLKPRKTQLPRRHSQLKGNNDA